MRNWGADAEQGCGCGTGVQVTQEWGQTVPVRQRADSFGEGLLCGAAYNQKNRVLRIQSTRSATSKLDIWRYHETTKKFLRFWKEKVHLNFYKVQYYIFFLMKKKIFLKSKLKNNKYQENSGSGEIFYGLKRYYSLY